MTRTLSCQKPSGDGQFSPVPNYFCQGAVKPPVSEACNTDVLCKGEHYVPIKIIFAKSSVFSAK